MKFVASSRYGTAAHVNLNVASPTIDAIMQVWFHPYIAASADLRGGNTYSNSGRDQTIHGIPPSCVGFRLAIHTAICETERKDSWIVTFSERCVLMPRL